MSLDPSLLCSSQKVLPEFPFIKEQNLQVIHKECRANNFLLQCLWICLRFLVDTILILDRSQPVTQHRPSHFCTTWDCCAERLLMGSLCSGAPSWVVHDFARATWQSEVLTDQLILLPSPLCSIGIATTPSLNHCVLLSLIPHMRHTKNEESSWTFCSSLSHQAGKVLPPQFRPLALEKKFKL